VQFPSLPKLENPNPHDPFHPIYESGVYLTASKHVQKTAQSVSRSASPDELFALSRLFTLLFSLLRSRHPSPDYIGLKDERTIIDHLADVVASLEHAAPEVSFVPDCLLANFRIVELIAGQDYEAAERLISAKSSEIDAMIRELPRSALVKSVAKILNRKSI